MNDATRNDITGAELVEQHWTYDGPHSSDTVTDAARALSMLVRYLNNATSPGAGAETLRYGPQVYRTIGHLHGALTGMDQLLEQISNELARIGQDPTVYDDRHGSDQEQGADIVADSSAIALQQARIWMKRAVGDLGTAWAQTSHLGHDLGGTQ